MVVAEASEVEEQAEAKEVEEATVVDGEEDKAELDEDRETIEEVEAREEPQEAMAVEMGEEEEEPRIETSPTTLMTRVEEGAIGSGELEVQSSSLHNRIRGKSISRTTSLL